MNKDQFNELLRNPNSVSNADSEALEKLLNNFPYCNVATVLLAKVSSDKGSMFSNQKLKRAALFSPSRERLKFLLTNNANEEPKAEPKIVIETKRIIDLDLNEMRPSVFEEAETASEEKKTFDDTLKDGKELKIETQNYFHEADDAQSKVKMQNLRDEIQEVLQSLKGLEAEFREKVNPESVQNPEPRKNPLDIIKEENSEPFIESVQENDLKVDDLLVDQPLKFYVHDLNFGKSLRNVSNDIINEYLAFRPFEAEQKPNLSTQASIIEKFLESSIQMPRFGDIAETSSKPDLSKPSTQLDSSLVSENMANIFVKQGKHKKAIEVYEKLMLKNPEKSSYFAGKIDNLNSLNK